MIYVAVGLLVAAAVAAGLCWYSLTGFSPRHSMAMCVGAILAFIVSIAAILWVGRALDMVTK